MRRQATLEMEGGHDVAMPGQKNAAAEVPDWA